MSSRLNFQVIIEKDDETPCTSPSGANRQLLRDEIWTIIHIHDHLTVTNLRNSMNRIRNDFFYFSFDFRTQTVMSFINNRIEGSSEVL